MRLSKNLLLAVCTLFSLATATASSNPTNSTSSEIREMLQGTLSTADFANDQKMHITFMLTEQNEIIVLSTSADGLDKEIKARLNYQVIRSTDLKKGEKYTLPIVIRK